jgi:hypothetical protein
MSLKITCISNNSLDFLGLYLVIGSKAGPTTFTYYDDVCFSTGEDRAANFVSIPIIDWGIICIASANSIEVFIQDSFKFDGNDNIYILHTFILLRL